MAALLTGDPSNSGNFEVGSSSVSRNGPVEVGRWYMSRKEIEENSPSRRDGIDMKKETYLRKSYCTFLQDLGKRLKVPQITIATAVIFCHRFFLRQSHAKNDRRTVATVCMFLAGKVEETPRPLKDVILVSYEIMHKKDPAAAHKIKQQKEVYEQQKELILIGERVVLATLGFDLNVHHPYKPLVEAIKKFQVAQNSLAQVAWNFVNDGLRTSLCLQFKPHHIAAGAIFLAAKFLKVRLPSDGEMVWWQEFDVTPRQLEEVSNQMLELYEQSRVPQSQGSGVEGSANGGFNHRAPAKTAVPNEEGVPANACAQAEAGTTSTPKPVAAKQSLLWPALENSTAEDYGASMKGIQYQSNDNGSSEMGSVITDQKVDGETPDRLKFGVDQIGGGEEEEKGGRNDTRSTREWKDNGAAASNKSNTNSWVGQEGVSSKSPHSVVKMIDTDKVKAALEKRRKCREEIIRRKELVDEDDLIERELEDGVELAAEDEKIGRERRQSWARTENPRFVEDQEEEALGMEVENVEEGEMLDDVSPKLNNRKRKERSPRDRQYHHNHHHSSNHKGHLQGNYLQ